MLSITVSQTIKNKKTDPWLLPFSNTSFHNCVLILDRAPGKSSTQNIHTQTEHVDSISTRGVDFDEGSPWGRQGQKEIAAVGGSYRPGGLVSSNVGHIIHSLFLNFANIWKPGFNIQFYNSPRSRVSLCMEDIFTSKERTPPSKSRSPALASFIVQPEATKRFYSLPLQGVATWRSLTKYRQSKAYTRL